MYRCRHFSIEELVYPELFEIRGGRCWELLDERALMTIDALREAFGPITVNDWHWGGDYRESGLRSFETSTGAKLSQHRFGRAFDCKFSDTNPREVYDAILDDPALFPHITTLENIEDTPTWLHFDVRYNRTNDGIRIVNP